MKEAPSSSETSVLTRATRRNIQKTRFFIISELICDNGDEEDLQLIRHVLKRIKMYCP
jgi:hypothetical protein